jgi:thiol-disulfide isomerase/thioredoxin
MKKLIFILLCFVLIFGLEIRNTKGTQAFANEYGQDIKDLFAKEAIFVLENKILAPNFSLPLIDGKQQSLADLKGKFVFLNFWATWCPPCRAEMPSMEKLYNRFKNKNLIFLAIDIRESQKVIEAFIKNFNLTFPIALDRTGDIAMKYGVQSIPMTFIIDKDGFIIATAIGSRNWNSSEIIEAFEILLKSNKKES